MVYHIFEYEYHTSTCNMDMFYFVARINTPPLSVIDTSTCVSMTVFEYLHPTATINHRYMYSIKSLRT